MNNLFIKEETKEKVVAIQWNGYNSDQMTEIFDINKVQVWNHIVGYKYKVDDYYNYMLKVIDENGNNHILSYYEWVVRFIKSGKIECYSDEEFRKTFYKD